jgi:hypothetical protein
MRHRRRSRGRNRTSSVLADVVTPRQLDIARRCRAELKKIFLSRPGGHADEAALDDIQELCLGAMRAIDDPVCGGRLLTIHCCAAALYSDTAHRHWNTPATLGVDRLRQRIFRALNAYERRLLRLDVSCPSSRPERDLLAWTHGDLRL